MLFNSIEFTVFLPLVFFIYWFVLSKNLRLQNLFIVICSYIFYGWWDWRFLFLIVFSSVVDYSIGLALLSQKNVFKRKILLWVSIIVNLGILGFFKYFNFFIENFTNAFSFFGAGIQVNSLHIILPVGISFYTFQTLSYTIDVYRDKLNPTKDFIIFSAFVSFFPQLVAGPIERATNLLPQFYKRRKFNYLDAVEGLKQILWGLFKKMVIADNCAHYANLIFNNYTDYSGSTLIVGAVFFTFQIYGDFSGYSDIAIGTSKLFGFRLMQNFSFPYFSRDIAEFWRRWHISLSTWFRDYVYIPLGGSRGGILKKIRNTFIIFLVSGFWHGANWTFIVWGALNALYYLPILLTNKNRNNLDIVAKGKNIPNFKEFSSIILTFALTVFTWIFFRAKNINEAITYIINISKNTFSVPQIRPTYLILLIVVFIITEWLGREQEFAIQKHINRHKVIRYLFYITIIITIFSFDKQKQDFIYFQF